MSKETFDYLIKKTSELLSEAETSGNPDSINYVKNGILADIKKEYLSLWCKAEMLQNEGERLRKEQ